MKKIICLILALLMVACLFAGCNKDVDPGKETEAPKASTEPKDPGETQADSKGTLKIGLLASLSGNAAVMGQDAKNALELYLEMNDYKIAGYDVELVVEDDEDNAETGVTKCTKLVEQDKVDIILGPQNAGQALGIKDYLADNEVPLLIYHAPVDPITKGQATDYIIRTQLSASQGTYPMGDYAYNTLGYHTAAVFTYDFTFGYQLAGGFIRASRMPAARSLPDSMLLSAPPTSLRSCRPLTGTTPMFWFINSPAATALVSARLWLTWASPLVTTSPSSACRTALTSCI